ncbi:relaxase domain-containing protein, partial [Acinetobacter baumannii]
MVATFEHSTSRALDPQLHTHALVMNIGVRDDGSTGTLSSLSLFETKMAAGALYRLHLSSLLERDLGVPLHRFR